MMTETEVISERECAALGKVDGIFLLRKSVGALKPLLELVS